MLMISPALCVIIVIMCNKLCTGYSLNKSLKLVLRDEFNSDYLNTDVWKVIKNNGNCQCKSCLLLIIK